MIKRMILEFVLAARYVICEEVLFDCVCARNRIFVVVIVDLGESRNNSVGFNGCLRFGNGCKLVLWRLRW